MALIQKIFPAHQQEDVGQLLALECGNNLPFSEEVGAIEMERIRFSVLKISKGNFDALLQAIQVAQGDWRDTLVEAGFADDVKEHSRWADRYLAEA